jgi:hypothetical protein
MGKLLLALLLVGNLWGDARYKLAYQIQANGLIRLVAGLAGLSKLSSDGDEVLLKGSRMLVKGEKSSILLNYANGQMVLIDHTDRTFERLKIEDMRKRIEADIPGPLIEGLKRLFPGGGSGMAVEVKVERIGDRAAMRSLAEYRARYGLSYLLPAMESLVSLMPGIEKAVMGIREGSELVEAMRFRIGAQGKILDGLVEIREYRESPVEESEMAAPQGYAEVK